MKKNKYSGGDGGRSNNGSNFNTPTDRSPQMLSPSLTSTSSASTPLSSTPTFLSSPSPLHSQQRQYLSEPNSPLMKSISPTIVSPKNINHLSISLLTKILLLAHDGIMPSQMFFYCMVVCKLWSQVVTKTLTKLEFKSLSETQCSVLLRKYLLAQEYNEKVESIQMSTLDNAMSVRILSGLTTPFFSKTTSSLYHPPINALEIFSIQLSEREIELISDVLTIYNIQRLALVGVQMTDTSLITLSKSLKLNYFNTLQHLNLSHNQITRKGLEFLFFAIAEAHRSNHIDDYHKNQPYYHNSHNSLNNSNIYSNNRVASTCSNNNNKLLSEVQINNIISIDLNAMSNMGITAETRTLDSSPILPSQQKLCHKERIKFSLLSLDLSSNSRLGLDSIEFFKQIISQMHELRELNLSGISLCKEGLDHLLECLRNTPTITSIKLCSNNIYPQGIEDIAVLLQDNNIKLLDISDNKVSTYGVKSIVNVLLDQSKVIELHSLYLRRTNVGFEEAVLLRNAIYHTKFIKILDLSCNQINHEAMAVISDSLSFNRTITDLDLSFNLFGPIGCAELAKCLKTNTTLKILKIHCVTMKKEGCQVITEALKHNTTLVHLIMSNNGIKNNGCSSFAKLFKVNQTITYCDLSCNGIKDKGATELSKSILEFHPSIKLDINGNSINFKAFRSNKDHCKLM
ncbi:hypothetical protein CYY_002207 [Polysphondylium violaceum]|uniref:Leucine-rich repeat-containing protein n=1 Tax=Polysphondylium violaceum TaxID=133409 RepID=A0A8J4Q1M7_9MYCE|nr:hypothetical protein CYY_002207 [Polysphondylium violaceum]